jgi:hypothetical protein
MTDPLQNRADLHSGPLAATGRGNTASIQRPCDAAMRFHAGCLNLSDNAGDILRKTISLSLHHRKGPWSYLVQFGIAKHNSTRLGGL